MANESSVLVRLRLLGGAAFARQANVAARGLGSLGDKGSVVSKSMGGVNKVLGVTAAAVKGVGLAAGAAAATGIAYAVKKGVNFEQSMANVQARLLTTKKNMDLLSGQAIKLGADTQFSAQEAADAMGEFAAAGFNAQQIMKIMPGTLDLAAASGSDLAFAAETSGAVIRQFGLHAKDAGHVADVLTLAVNKSAISLDDMALSMKYVGPVAGRFNQSLEDMSAATAILGNVGIKGETAGTTLRRALVNLVKPSKRTVTLLDDAGISVSDFAKATVDAHGNLRPMPQILGNLSDSFKDLTKPERRKLLAQLFGVEALPGMITLMDMGEKRIDKMSGTLEHSGGAAKRTAAIMRNTVAGAWDNFTGSVESAAISLVRKFQPAMRDTINKAAGLVDRVPKIAGDLASGLSGAAGKPGKHVAARGQSGLQDVPAPTGAAKAGLKIRSLLSPVVSWAQSALPKIGEAMGSAVSQLVDALKPAQPFLQNVILPLFKGVGIGLLGSVVGAFKVAIPMIKIFAQVLGFVGRVLAPFRGVIQGIGTVVGFLAAGPILKLLSGMKYIGVAARVLGVPLKIAAAGFRIVFGAVARAASIFVRAHLAVLRFGGTMAGVGRRVVVSVANFVGGVITKVGGLVGKIRALGGKFLNVGKGIVRKLFDGIKAGFSAVGGFVGSIGRQLANWLNEHTPLGDRVKAGPIHFTLPSLATGGVVRSGGLAVVGERGPELAHLPGGTTVYDANQTRRARGTMASGGDILLTANLHLSGEQIHQEVFRVNRRQAEAR